MVGSDSGRIAILEYNQPKNQFERIHMETFGKSGCRRIVPGQYLAIDPKGRAVMIGEALLLIPIPYLHYFVISITFPAIWHICQVTPIKLEES